jgi:Family of unknown function (DUF5706)
MPDSSDVVGAGTAQEKAERKRLLSDRGQAVALMHFDHIERQVALAVTKASLLVAASAFIVGAYIRVVVDFRIFSFLGSADLSKAVLVVGGACLMLGFTCALVAVFPKRGSGAERNALYYGWISSVVLDDYQEQFQREDRDNELDRNMLRQIWAKSLWLDRMFWYTSASIWFIVLGSWLCIVALAFASNDPKHEAITQSPQPAAETAQSAKTPQILQPKNGKK